MKIDIKELQKTLKYLEKNGNPSQINVDFDSNGRFRISVYTEEAGQIIITIYESEYQKMAEVTRTERL